ncbi:hypothetical protein GCM10027425_03850 [Alteromonas gracilis]
MRTRDLVALAAAGVIGVSGGIGAGVWRSHDQTARPSGATTRATPEPPPVATQPLLYATAASVVDGDRRSAHDLGEVPLVVVRAQGGYLLSTGEGSGLGDQQELTFVSRSGESTPIATVTGDWDLDEGGTRVVGLDAQSARVTVWGLDADVELTGDTPLDPRSSVVFADGGILAATYDEPGTTRLVRIDPETGRTTQTGDAAPAYLAASRDGTTLVGAVSLDRQARLDEAYCLAGRPADQPRNAWASCEWRRPYAPQGPEVSPSGDSVLGITFQDGGYGPGEFGILDSRRGAADLIRIDAPDLTWEAAFADDRTLYVRAASHGRSDGTAAAWFFRCTAQSCRRIAQEPDLDARLGTSR